MYAMMPIVVPGEVRSLAAVSIASAPATVGVLLLHLGETEVEHLHLSALGNEDAYRMRVNDDKQ
jgi:hypothetical protein